MCCWMENKDRTLKMPGTGFLSNLSIVLIKNTYMMSRNNEDPVTHTARIYEITRLPLDFLEKIEINISL